MALTTRTNVKLLLGIADADTSKDTILDLLIAHAETVLENYLDRRIETGTYTEYYQGNGLQELFLKNTPVESITSIYEDRDGYYGDGASAFPASTLLTAGTDYVLDKDDASETEVSRSGIVYRIGGVWGGSLNRKRGQLTASRQPAKGNIKVTYVGGYQTVPNDIAFCANRLVVSIYNDRASSGKIVSESFEDWSQSLAAATDESASLSSVQSVLARYRRIVI